MGLVLGKQRVMVERIVVAEMRGKELIARGRVGRPGAGRLEGVVRVLELRGALEKGARVGRGERRDRDTLVDTEKEGVGGSSREGLPLDSRVAKEHHIARLGGDKDAVPAPRRKGQRCCAPEDGKLGQDHRFRDCAGRKVKGVGRVRGWAGADVAPNLDGPIGSAGDEKGASGHNGHHADRRIVGAGNRDQNALLVLFLGLCVNHQKPCAVGDSNGIGSG